MSLTEEQRELRWQMEVVAYLGIHSIEYFNGVTGKGGEFWAFTQNCYGERACHLWCQLFNSYYKDPTHYNNLFGNDALSYLGNEFKLSNIKNRLITTTGLDEEGYIQFRESVVNFRNQYSAHRDYAKEEIVFPNLELALLMFHELRDVLSESVKAELSQKPGDGSLKGLSKYYQYHQRSDIQRKCRNNVSKI